MKKSHGLLSGTLTVLVLICLLLTAAPAALADAEMRGPVVKFSGAIGSMPEDGFVGEWTIAGEPVVVNENTEINEERGAAEIGAQVMVIAMRDSADALNALLIRVEGARPQPEVILHGIVRAVTDDFIQLNGQIILLVEETVVEGDLQVGSFVIVHARLNLEVRPPQFVALHIQVLENERQHLVSWNGIIEEMGEPDGEGKAMWVVAGRAVLVTPTTLIEGEPALGARVHVLAMPGDGGDLVALIIKVLPAEFEYPKSVTIEGIVTYYPPRGFGAWMVDETEVVVRPQTTINGNPGLGAEVRIVAVQHGPDAALQAVTVEVLEEGEPGAGFPPGPPPGKGRPPVLPIEPAPGAGGAKRPTASL